MFANIVTVTSPQGLIDDVQKDIIYTAHKEVNYKENWDLFFSKAQKRKLKVRIFVVDRKTDNFDFHERKIYFNTSKRRLAIGYGLDTIKIQYDKSGKRKTEMRDCHLTLDDDMEYRNFFVKNHAYSELTLEKIYE